MANMSHHRSTRVTRCSLVVSPVDVWTRRLLAPSALSVSLEGIHKKPIRKPDGTFLFLDLPSGSYVLSVTSSVFIPYRKQIETASISKLYPMITVPLLPSPKYAYPADSTAVTFELCNAARRPCADAEVWAYICEDAAARGRIMQDSLLAGADTAAVGQLQGQTVAGESLLLRGQGNEELVRVAEILPGNGLRFEQPLKENYRRGALLLPAVQTSSANNGIVILPFRGILPKSFPIKVFAINEHGSAATELTAQAGEVVSAQTLVLQ